MTETRGEYNTMPPAALCDLLNYMSVYQVRALVDALSEVTRSGFGSVRVIVHCERVTTLETIVTTKIDGGEG